MNAQSIVVALVVIASAIYAAWMLMPASLRRVLAAAALRLPLPAVVAARMRVHASAASSCGCSGCDRNPLAKTSAASAATPAIRPIKLHRRLPG